MNEKYGVLQSEYNKVKEKLKNGLQHWEEIWKFFSKLKKEV